MRDLLLSVSFTIHHGQKKVLCVNNISFKFLPGKEFKERGDLYEPFTSLIVTINHLFLWLNNFRI